MDECESFMTADTIEDVVIEYNKIHNKDFDSSDDALIKLLKERGWNLETCKVVLLSHFTFRLSADFIYSAKELAVNSGYSENIVESILNKLSFTFGDLYKNNPEYYFLDNPVWTHPFIKISQNEYYCPMPHLFFSFIFETFNMLMGGNLSLVNSYQKSRSEYLENEVASIMKNKFPDYPFKMNLKWQDGEIEYETDFIMKVSSFLFIIEAKSGAVSRSALRGAPESLKRHIDELIVAPAIQSERLYNKIKCILAKSESNYLSGQLGFSIDDCKEIIRISVTLDDFAMLQSNIGLLKECKLYPGNLSLVPTLTIADFSTIADLFSSAIFISYFLKRTYIENNLKYFGDEVDLMGFYLKTGFNFEIPGDDKLFILTGMSKPVDDYYTVKQRGKPVLNLTKWWRDILDRIATKKFPAWIEYSCHILNLSYEEQEEIERKIDILKSNVKEHFNQLGMMDSLVVCPNENRKIGFAFLVHKNIDREIKIKRLENLAGEVFSKSNVQHCIGFAINIDNPCYPYSTLALLENPKKI